MNKTKLTTGQNIVIVALDKFTGGIIGYYTTVADRRNDRMVVKITKDITEATVFESYKAADTCLIALNGGYTKIERRDVTWRIGSMQITLSV